MYNVHTHDAYVYNSKYMFGGKKMTQYYIIISIPFLGEVIKHHYIHIIAEKSYSCSRL